MTIPEIRYAKSGDVHVAYQVVGDGPRDLVLIPGWVSPSSGVEARPSTDSLRPSPRMERFAVSHAGFLALR